jgi:hypothetical protein
MKREGATEGIVFCWLQIKMEKTVRVTISLDSSWVDKALFPPLRAGYRDMVNQMPNKKKQSLSQKEPPFGASNQSGDCRRDMGHPEDIV